MKKQFKILLALMLIVPCVGFLVACGGVNAGFASPEKLGEAWVKTEAKTVIAPYGEGATFNEGLQFSHGAKTVNSAPTLLKAVQEIYTVMSKEAKDKHKAKMDGNWVIEYNEDGTAKTKFSGTDLETYKKTYNDAKSKSKSFKYVSATKDTTATTTAAGAATAGTATHVEVWNVKYEYTPYVDGVAQTTVEETEPLTVYKVGGKWYTDSGSGLGGIMGGLGGLL